MGSIPIINHLPILQVIVPLMAAPVCAVLRPRLAWAVALLASALALLIAIGLLMRVLAGEAISYAVGGWAPPWGIELRVDALSALVLIVVTGMGFGTAIFARLSVEQEILKPQIPVFYAAYLLCLAGLLGITVTGDVFNLFVFLEISSLASYALIAQGRDRCALTAAFRYLVMGTIGATFILIGIGLMYLMTGTLNMIDLAHRLPAVQDTRTIRAALAFITVGVSLKLALYPLHLWLPNAYTWAPSAVTVLLAATSTKVAFYVLLRFIFTVFGAPFAFGLVHLDYALLPISLAAVVVASVLAILQDNVKRLLAYSSIAQIGYMTLGVGLVTEAGLKAGIVHLFNHALIKGALFMTLGCVIYRLRSARIEDLAGIGRQMPWTMAAFVIGGLSLIGVPPTAGFVSKWYLVLAALEKGWWPVAFFVVASSLLTLAYVWRVVEVAYFGPKIANTVRTEAPLALLIPTWLLVILNLYFGLDASVSAGMAQCAAAVLLGGP